MYLNLMHLCCTLQKEEEKPKEKEKGKSRNIDHFMEELKQEQEMREKRNQERGEHWRDGRHGEHSIVSDTFFLQVSILHVDACGWILCPPSVNT